MSRWQPLLQGGRLSVGLSLAAVAALAIVAAWAFYLGFGLGPGAAASLLPSVATPDSTLPSLAVDTQAGPWPLALDVGAKLVAVVALIYGLSAMAKRYLLRMPPASQGALRVLDARSLGPRKTVYLVEVGGRVLVLGTTDSSITNLTEFNDPEVVNGLKGGPQGSAIDFTRLLSLSLGSLGSKAPSPSDSLPARAAGATSVPLDRSGVVREGSPR